MGEETELFISQHFKPRSGINLCLILCLPSCHTSICVLLHPPPPLEIAPQHPLILLAVKKKNKSLPCVHYAYFGNPFNLKFSSDVTKID